jgi:molybdopterin/thiamine biosynthesis adenylyltransferase
MNPKLKGRIVARLEKVCEQTEDIFTDNFFQSTTIVMNALDNVQARRYVDRRCVDNKTALLESGTLGPKGHVQCILPYLTESYGSKNDPVEEGDIPYCTLKMFPEETFHCVEFARDVFGKLFSLRPKNAIKAIETESKPTTPEEL